MEDLKTLIITTLAALAAYFSPIYGMVLSATVIFILRFIVGYLTSKRVDNEDFSFKKAFNCVIEATVFYVLISCTFFIGDHMNNQNGALQSISMITYALLYFFSVNVTGNLKRLFQESQWIAFIHYVISIEFIKNVSFIDTFLKQKNDNGKN